MQAERAALVILGNRLDHRAEDVRVDLHAGLTAAWPLRAHSQQKTMPVVGWLWARPLPRNPAVGPIHDGLRQTGYIEGENFTSEYRSADGNYDRLPALAQELVSRKVDLIVTIGGTPTALAAKNATSTVPIVFGVVSDPVAAGLVTSLGRPGGNVTGVASLDAEMTPKQLELLSELVPQAKIIALLVNPDNPPVTETVIKAVQGAAHSRGLDVPILKAASNDEIDAAFASLNCAPTRFSSLATSFSFLNWIALPDWWSSIPFPPPTIRPSLYGAAASLASVWTTRISVAKLVFMPGAS